MFTSRVFTGLAVAVVLGLLLSLPVGAATGGPMSVRIGPSADGEGIVFSGTIPSAKAGQEVLLQRRLRGSYKTVAKTVVRGKARAFAGLDTGRLQVEGTRQYRLTSGSGGDREQMRPKVTCRRLAGGIQWIIFVPDRGLSFVLPYTADGT
jgi:hypothetical protein